MLIRRMFLDEEAVCNLSPERNAEDHFFSAAILRMHIETRQEPMALKDPRAKYFLLAVNISKTV